MIHVELIWWAENLANIKLRLFADPEVMDSVKNENSIAICTHGSDVDWLVGWLVVYRYSCIGASKSLIKKSLGYLPILGWTWWFLEFILLSRSW